LRSTGVTAEGDGIAIGATGVRVDANIDFLCPFCRQFAPAMANAHHLLSGQDTSSPRTRAEVVAAVPGGSPSCEGPSGVPGAAAAYPIRGRRPTRRRSR
jgi:hypothetical protein